VREQSAQSARPSRTSCQATAPWRCTLQESMRQHRQVGVGDQQSTHKAGEGSWSNFRGGKRTRHLRQTEQQQRSQHQQRRAAPPRQRHGVKEAVWGARCVRGLKVGAGCACGNYR
jgi:L-lactate utilization protein LutB